VNIKGKKKKLGAYFLRGAYATIAIIVSPSGLISRGQRESKPSKPSKPYFPRGLRHHRYHCFALRGFLGI